MKVTIILKGSCKNDSSAIYLLDYLLIDKCNSMATFFFSSL